MTTATPITEGEIPPRGNAHNVSERGRAIIRRLKAHAAAKGLPATLVQKGRAGGGREGERV